MSNPDHSAFPNMEKKELIKIMELLKKKKIKRCKNITQDLGS